MEISGGVLIATHEAREACKGEADLIERVKKAMRACHGHWMETNEGEQLRAALAAAMLESPDEIQKDRIARSAQALSKMGAALNAISQGVSLDVIETFSQIDDDILPIRQLWNETKKAA
jgi:nicotinate-nucleotide pyrophosphorylase